MNVERARRAEAIFMELMDRRPAERHADLLAQCAGDHALQAEVESLLAAHDKDGPFLDNQELLTNSLGFMARALQDDGTIPPGTRIGEYTIERVLGEGGMGVVYVARQERPRRTVAVKAIRRGLASPSLIRRFEHEAEVLGRLQHPGIAQIFEAGAALVSGHEARGPQPFIAMELIDGDRLTEYARDNALSTRAKLELVAKVCDAVNHAHLRGVIHRDLKPANILIDKAGQPKVLDFGVARAADADLRVTTMQTSVGQLIGTLPYMSPEQVLADPNEVDTRSDVYALGVILYEVLTGKLPINLSSRSIPEAARLIRDEAPASLSSISRVFRGDVDTIVAKAIEKDKARRYQSAAELAEDIHKHLRGEPISAKADSALYVLRKQIRRYRGAVAAGIGFVVILAGFAGYAGVQAATNKSRAEREEGLKINAELARDDALEATKRADAAAEQLAQELSLSTIDRGRLLGMTGNGAGAERLLWPELFTHPDSPAAFWAMWELYSNNPILRTLEDDAYVPTSPACTPDGSSVALARKDKTVSVMSADLSRELWRTPAMRTAASYLAFSPDGKRLLIGTMGGSCVLVDNQDSEGQRLQVHRDFVTTAVFSPDGRYILTGSTDGPVHLINAADGTTLRDLADSNGRVSSACFSPDSERLAVIFANGAVLLWSSNALDAPPTRVQLQGRSSACVFTPDSKQLLIGSDDSVVVMDGVSGEVQRELPIQGDTLRSMEFSADGATLILCGDRGSEAWEGSTLTHRMSLANRDSITMVGAIVPKTERCVTVNRNGFVRLQELRPGLATIHLRDQGGWVLGGTVAPDNRHLLVVHGGKQAGIIVWDLLGVEPPTPLIEADSEIRGIATDPSGTRFATCSRDGKAIIWDAATLAPLIKFDATKESLAACFSADGQSFITTIIAKSGDIAPVYQWSLGTDAGVKMRTFSGLTGSAKCVAYRPRSRQFATAGGSPSLATWDVDTGQMLKSFAGEVVTWCVAYNPEGTLLAVPGRERSVEIRDPDTLEVKFRLVGHADIVLACDFSPDGKILATSSVDGSCKLWEVSNGRLLATVRTGRKQLGLVKFTADGRRLISGGQDEAVSILDLKYYEQHIAGNVRYQDRWLRRFTERSWDSSPLEAWAQGLLEPAATR